MLFQQGTFAPDSAFRWMASIAMDKAGDMLMGYSVSSNKISPAIRFTGRSASDPRNQMGAEQAGVSGSGSQLTPERWGDYASMSIDPSDDCTFWFSTQYVSQTGKFNWSTKIIPVKFDSCQSPDAAVVGDCNRAELPWRYHDGLFGRAGIRAGRQRLNDVCTRR